MKDYIYQVNFHGMGYTHGFKSEHEKTDLESLCMEAARNWHTYCIQWIIAHGWPVDFEIFHEGVSLGTRTVTTETIYMVCDDA